MRFLVFHLGVGEYHWVVGGFGVKNPKGLKDDRG